MKKKIIILICILFLLNGCSNNSVLTLEKEVKEPYVPTTINQKDGGYIITYTTDKIVSIQFESEEDGINKMIIEMETTAKDELAFYDISDMYEQQNNIYADENDGVIYSLEIDEKKWKFKIVQEIDLELCSKESLIRTIALLNLQITDLTELSDLFIDEKLDGTLFIEYLKKYGFKVK